MNPVLQGAGDDVRCHDGIRACHAHELCLVRRLVTQAGRSTQAIGKVCDQRPRCVFVVVPAWPHGWIQSEDERRKNRHTRASLNVLAVPVAAGRKLAVR